MRNAIVFLFFITGCVLRSEEMVQERVTTENINGEHHQIMYSMMDEGNVLSFILRAQRYKGADIPRPAETHWTISIEANPIQLSCMEEVKFMHLIPAVPLTNELFATTISGTIVDRCNPLVEEGTQSGGTGGGEDEEFDYDLLLGGLKIVPPVSEVLVEEWIELTAQKLTGEDTDVVWRTEPNDGVLYMSENGDRYDHYPRTNVWFKSSTIDLYHVYGRRFEVGGIDEGVLDLQGVATVDVQGWIDLDIDSDNNNELSDPERTHHEDELEEDSSHPGKSLFINHLDRDKDGIPDYADGFDLEIEGVSQAANDASNDFAPVLLGIPEDVDVEVAKVIFECAYLSDPSADVEHVSTNGVHEYNLTGSGRIRLWRKNGSESRNKECVTEYGDAILPGTAIPLRDLSPVDGVVRLYVEALKRSDSLGDVTINVKMNPSGSDDEEDYVASDVVKATVFGVENVHPLADDFDEGHEGRVLISAKHGGGFYTDYQTENYSVNIIATVKPTPPIGWRHLKVYFEVTDPDDLSHYEGKEIPTNPAYTQGDKNPNDNRDVAAKKRMTTGLGDDYVDYQNACLSDRSAEVVVDEEGGFASTELKITDRYSGDNYQVRATLQKPQENKPFDMRTSWTDDQDISVSTIKESVTMIAWKRVYLELGRMYHKGATLVEDAAEGATLLEVDNILDFEIGDQVVLFSPSGASHITEIVDFHPKITITGGGGEGAKARVKSLRYLEPIGGISEIEVTNLGTGYTSVPDVELTDNPGSGAVLEARLKPTGVQLEILNQGEGYTEPPTLQIGSPDIPGGVQATVSFTTITDGRVFIAINPGSGYTKPPRIIPVGGDGQGFSVRSLLQPTEVKWVSPKNAVLSAGSGYKFQITIQDALPRDFKKYDGIRPVIEPEVFDVDFRYVKDAFGDQPDGEDGGAFIEFKHSLGRKVPKYSYFPAPVAAGVGDYSIHSGFSQHWRLNIDATFQHNNYTYIVAANDAYEFGVYMPEFNTIFVYPGTAHDIQVEETLIHELGHSRTLMFKREWVGNFDHIDSSQYYIPFFDSPGIGQDPLPANRYSNDGRDGCVMSYASKLGEGVAEFCIPILIDGPGEGTGSSLRDGKDR